MEKRRWGLLEPLGRCLRLLGPNRGWAFGRLVDELSLGLAPLVVQRLLDVLLELAAAGQAMLIVEQSLTVAARLAERVVFLEKGAIRFDGPIAELTARDEFARAVFLGGAS